MLLGVIPAQSAPQSIATAPEFLWEAYLALWLTFKGFRQVTFGAGEASDVRTVVGSPVDAVAVA